jgi:hypothetical protein
VWASRLEFSNSKWCASRHEDNQKTSHFPNDTFCSYRDGGNGGTTGIDESRNQEAEVRTKNGPWFRVESASIRYSSSSMCNSRRITFGN